MTGNGFRVFDNLKSNLNSGKKTPTPALPRSTRRGRKERALPADSYLQHQPRWVFQILFHSHQEADGFLAVHQAVVVAQSDVHHRADFDFVVDDDGAFLDDVHAED